MPPLASRNFLNRARTGKVHRDHWRDHYASRFGHVERFRAKMAWADSRRHSNRARTFCFLFSHRYVHHHQHRAQPASLAILDLPSLGGSASPIDDSRWRKTMAKIRRRRSMVGVMARSNRRELLGRHVDELLKCRRCPRMKSTPVSGGAAISNVMIIGQAPGPREPTLKRPFAHTAGKTLFRWFEQFCGMDEAAVRSRIYFAAVCRCFPGKNSSGTDRVPAPDEIRNCSSWMEDEIRILQPRLIIPVGRLAITQFIDCVRLQDIIGRKFRVTLAGHRCDLIPLPHPSGASPWHKIPPGRALTERALKMIARHSAVAALCERRRRS